MGAFDEQACTRTDCREYPELAELLGHDPDGHRHLTALRMQGITTVKDLALAPLPLIPRLGPTSVEAIRTRLRAAGIGPVQVAELESAGQRTPTAGGADGHQPAARALEFADHLTAAQMLDAPLRNLITKAWMSGYHHGVHDATQDNR